MLPVTLRHHHSVVSVSSIEIMASNVKGSAEFDGEEESRDASGDGERRRVGRRVEALRRLSSRWTAPWLINDEIDGADNAAPIDSSDP